MLDFLKGEGLPLGGPVDIRSDGVTFYPAESTAPGNAYDRWKAVEAEKDFPAHVMTALRLASLTGLRLSDLVRLQWSDVSDKAVIVAKTRKRGGRASSFSCFRMW